MLRPFLYSFVFFSSVCWSHRPTRSVLGGEDQINKYDITYPKVIKQPQNEVQGPGHPDELTVELTVEGKKFTLELELNKVVFSKNFKHTVRGGSGYKEYTNMENCYYQGKVREEPEWSAVISTCKGLRGAFGVFTVRNNSYYIEPMEGKVNGAHIVYRPSELSDSHFSGKCGSETGDSSELHDIPSFPVQKKDFNNSKVKRQADTDLYLELYIVTDVAAFTSRGGDMESLLQDVTETVNAMDNCPTNRFLRNGYNCTNGNESGYCIDGQCLTHSTQCRSIYGSGSSSAPAQCYDYNTEGNCWGKCGRVGVTDTFTACREEDILCGMTWCVPPSLPPRDVPSDSQWAINRCGNGVITARSVCYNGTNAEVTDPGYVWDNIRCGTNKVCMNQRCVTANFTTNTCPVGINGTECNGNGVCTNKNICFCDPGFTGPACDNRAVISTQPTPEKKKKKKKKKKRKKLKFDL